MTTQLLDFWFCKENEKLWFNCNPNDDKLITIKYLGLLENSTTTLVSLSSRKDYLHYIILYDQITRHIDRVMGTNYKDLYSTKALEYTEYLIENYGTLEDSFTPPEICFLLMPFRHSFQLDKLQYVLTIVNQLTRESPYYKRFYYATITSISNIKLPILTTSPDIDNNINTQLLCSSCNFQNDIVDNKVMSSLFTQSFLDLIPINEPITISLSGGADSMVCSYIVKKLGYDVIALMIDYNNRETSNLEVDMVASWCHKIDIPLYVRTIDEITRTRDSDREFYERITKKIRYNGYKYLQRSVILGHNLDDCMENIITNINKQTNIDNLLGMKPNSTIDDIIFLRPLLDIKKQQIIEFANNHNIPYLYDSTPKWSQRGKIRDILVPNINKYDTQLLENLVKISKRYSDIYHIYQDLLLTNTKIEVLENDNTNLKKYKITYMDYYNLDYWKMVFMELYKLYDITTPSIKSLHNFIRNLKEGKSKMVLTKEMTIENKDDYLLVLIK